MRDIYYDNDNYTFLKIYYHFPSCPSWSLTFRECPPTFWNSDNQTEEAALLSDMVYERVAHMLEYQQIRDTRISDE